MEDLEGKERGKFFAVIDNLRDIGLGSDISLPQVRREEPCFFNQTSSDLLLACGCG